MESQVYYSCTYLYYNVLNYFVHVSGDTNSAGQRNWRGKQFRLVRFMRCLRYLRTNGTQSEREVTTSLNNPDRTNRGVTPKRNKAQTSQLNAKYRKRAWRAAMFLACTVTKGQLMKTQRQSRDLKSDAFTSESC